MYKLTGLALVLLARCLLAREMLRGEFHKAATVDPIVEPVCECANFEDPQCCNGQQYGSPCLAACANAENCSQGPCQATDPCICYDLYLPVCCQGQKQYANQCLADCASAQNCTSGECAPGGGQTEITCLNPRIIVDCFADPCSVSTCPSYPDAWCLPSYCSKGVYRGTQVGPCQALFVDQVSGDVLDCGTSLDDDLLGDWKITKVRCKFGLCAYPKNTKATLKVTSNGDNTGVGEGTTGCNFYRAEYSVAAEGKIDLDAFLTTRIACSGAAGLLEKAFIDAMGTVDEFVVDGSKLKLLSGGKVALAGTR